MELSGQNATEAEGKSSAQCLQHPGLQLATCEKPRPVSYFRKVLFMCVLDLCLIPWHIASKFINGSSYKTLHTCSSFCSLCYLHFYTPFLLLAFSIPRCWLHSPSSVFTDRSAISENDAVIKSGTKRDDKILDLFQKSPDFRVTEFLPMAGWHEAAFSCALAVGQGEGSQFCLWEAEWSTLACQGAREKVLWHGTNLQLQLQVAVTVLAVVSLERPGSCLAHGVYLP